MPVSSCLSLEPAIHRKRGDQKRVKVALQQQMTRERLITRITQNIRDALDMQTILQTRSQK
ncbi:MAG: hypothetical protein HC810_01385 [Acaryochloridaceae cyanobacterium RL_2_7]|nr:hypothetical protein [Acaryochloridaceae cyanobacterium RL_2_7]